MLHLPGTPQQPRFTEGATEAQRGGVTCPESHGVGGRAYQKVEQGEGLTGSDEGWGSPEWSWGGVGRPGRRKQPNAQQGSCTERQPPRPVWEAGRGRHEGEPGTAPSCPCWEEEGKAGPWGPGGEPTRRNCCQGGHRAAGGGEGANLRVWGSPSLEGLSPGRACSDKGYSVPGSSPKDRPSRVCRAIIEQVRADRWEQYLCPGVQ